MNRIVYPLAALLIASSGWASAQSTTRETKEHKLGAHPAVIVAARGQTGIDPNRFIVGHPASPQWRLSGEDATAFAAATVSPAGTTPVSR